MATIAEHMERIEQEYGEPFWDVVRQYGADGESITATANILEIKPTTFFAMVDANNCRDWFPSRFESNGVKNRVITTSARTDAHKSKKIKETMLKKHGFWHDGHFDTMRGHAIRVGMSPFTAGSRIKMGWSKEDALTLKPLISVGGKNTHHPGRSCANKTQKTVHRIEFGKIFD